MDTESVPETAAPPAAAPAESSSVLLAPPPPPPAAPTTEAPKPLELKLPAGWKADDKALADFKARALKAGLDSAKAQDIFDGYVAADAAREGEAKAARAAQDKAWRAAIDADPGVGGEKFAEAVVDARRVLSRPGGAKVIERLAAAGLDNHPDIFRFFVELGRGLREDSVSGSAASGNGAALKPLHEVLYSHPSTHQE